MAVKVFYHVCATGPWEAVVRDQLAKVHWSGLYDAAEAVHCWVSGPEAAKACDVLREHGAKIVVEACAPGDTSYERLTLLGMRPLVRPGDRLLYLHSKGVTKDNRRSVLHWRQYMEHTLVRHWRRCVDLLEVADAVGVNFATRPAPHYSGNFWWCTGAHYLKLPRVIGDDYLDPEMHVLSVQCNAVAFPGSGVNHQEAEFPLAAYCDLKEPAQVRRV
jgi:hypothetical protein